MEHEINNNISHKNLIYYKMSPIHMIKDCVLPRNVALSAIDQLMKLLNLNLDSTMIEDVRS